MSANKTLLAFIAGSSFPAIAIPFFVLGTALLLRPEQAFPPQILLWGLPLIMGLWNIALLRFAPALPGKGNTLTHWLAGITIGLAFTSLGVSSGAPGKLYNLHGHLAFVMMPIGMFAHGFIWGVIVHWVNRKLGLRP